jgi:hypothetical protein
MARVVYRIGIFRSLSVGISWYLPYQYQRKSWSVHFGNIFLAGTPFSLEKGALAPFLREKGGTGPLFDTGSPPFAEKRSSRQTSNTNQNTDRPVKSDTGKIPILKKLLVTSWYTTLKMANFCRVIDQSFRPNTPNKNGCANLSSFRDVAHVLTYWCKAVWAVL